MHYFQEPVLRKYVDSFDVETRFIYIFVILHRLSCSTMWSSAHRGQRFPDWSEAFALWHTLCGALPVRWQFPAAPHSHHQVSRQRQMGPAQDHLYEVWVTQLYSLNVNLKNQMTRLFFCILSKEISPLQTPPPQVPPRAQKAQEARFRWSSRSTGGSRPFLTK